LNQSSLFKSYMIENVFNY